jgi:hypothetical protein
LLLGVITGEDYEKQLDLQRCTSGE